MKSSLLEDFKKIALDQGYEGTVQFYAYKAQPSTPSYISTSSAIGGVSYLVYDSKGSPLKIWEWETTNVYQDITLTEPTEPGGTIGDGDGVFTPFTPPTPLTPKQVSDIPFYQNLVNNGEIETLDDLSESEYNYMQSEIQKKEVGWFDTIINKTKDFIKISTQDSYKDVTIKYDENIPELVSYYADNNLDTTKDYSFNIDGLRVGIKNNNSYEVLNYDSKINNSGTYTVSTATKDKFLSDPQMFVGLKTSPSTSGFNFSTPNIVHNVGVGSTIGILTSGVLDDLAENTVDGGVKLSKVVGSGIVYTANKAKDLYHDWTNTGDKTKDIFNHQVQSEAYTKGMNTVTQGEGANMAETTGTVTIDTSKISIEPLTIAPGASIAPLTLAPEAVFQPLTLASEAVFNPLTLDPSAVFNPLTLHPDAKLPVDVGTKTIPLDVAGKKILLNIASDDSIKLKVDELTKVSLDIPEDVALPVDGLDENFKAVYKNKADNITKTDDIINKKIEAHKLEYSENGIRAKEGSVATYEEKVFTTTVKQGLNDIDGVGRKIQAWKQRHSLNTKTNFEDSYGETIEIKEGYYANQDPLIKAYQELGNEKFDITQARIYYAKNSEFDLKGDDITGDLKNLDVARPVFPDELSDYENTEKIAIKFFDSTAVLEIQSNLDLES